MRIENIFMGPPTPEPASNERFTTTHVQGHGLEKEIKLFFFYVMRLEGF